MRRTSSHQSYAEPTRLDIQARFDEIDFNKSFSFDLVKDIANAYSHVMAGGVASHSFESISSQMGVMPTEKKEALEYKKQLDYHKNVQEFLNTLDFNAFTGDTPLQKAASIVSALSSQDGGEGKEGEGMALPIFMESKESVKKKTEKLQEDVKSVVEASKDASRYIFNPEFKAPEVALASLSNSQRDILTKLAILGDRGKIKARRTSATQTIEQMSEYSQIARISNMTAMGMPTFGYKFATKQLMVRTPKQSGKQLMVLLIDDSSSMYSTQKEQWVKTLIIDRVNAVAKGETVLYIGCFERDVDLSSIIKIATKQEAIDFLKSDWFPNQDGSSTDIQKAVKTTCQAIKIGQLGKYKLNSTSNPQIVVINDGQDTVDGEYCPEVTTHGFILGQDNDGMKSMISNCSGHYERFL